MNNLQTLSVELKGVDVVVSAFYSGCQNSNLYDAFLKGLKAMEEATKLTGVNRLIVIGGAEVYI